MCTESDLCEKCFSFKTFQKSWYGNKKFRLEKFNKNIIDIIICLNAKQQPQIISNDMKKSVGFFDEIENECSM